jgi:hypothetical protein
MVRALLAPTLAASFSVACGKDLPRLPLASASRGCTQEDLPALVVVLTETVWSAEGSPPLPHVRIEISGVAPGSSERVELSPLRRDPTKRTLARALFRDVDGSSTWLSGFVEIHNADDPGSSVRGTYRFCIPRDSCTTGSLSAPLRRGIARCG